MKMVPAAAQFKRPPGPSNHLPVLGVLREFRADPPGYLLRVAREYGDVAHFRVANQHIYAVADPELIREVLVTQQHNFVKSRVLERARALLGNGLLTSEGELHTRQRRLAQPAFHRDRLMRYGADMVACTEQTRRQLHTGEVDVLDVMTNLTLAIVGKTLFSADVTSKASEIGGALTEIFALFPHLMMPFSEILMKLPLPATKRFERARGKLDRIVYGLIAERRASGADAGDLLSMLLLARDDDRSRMSDEQVRDEALTLLLAGHETTANALTWCWYLLSQNPTAEALFHREIDQALEGRPPSFDDLPRLPYTLGVFAESLRLYPPAWGVGRKAVRAFSLGEYIVPAGSIILMSPWVVHRDARWFSDPEKFDPGRWASREAENQPKFSYFPFGGGTRTCIGERFAWAEGVLVLATLAQKWKMRLVPGHPIATLARITLRPKFGIKMLLEER